MTGSRPHSSPNSSATSSDIRPLSHGGSHTSSTFADLTCGSTATLRWTSPTSEPATGHAGESLEAELGDHLPVSDQGDGPRRQHFRESQETVGDFR